MEAKELRIGNLVTDEWNSRVIKVDSIDDKGINLEIEDDGNYPELAKRWIEPCYKFECLYPIPLTEKLLLNFGFSKINYTHGDSFYTLSRSKINKCYIDIYDSSTKYMGYSVRHCKYVHQLQNLYFALTREELVFTE